MKRLICSSLFFALLCLNYRDIGAAGETAFRVVSSSSNELVFQYVPRSYTQRFRFLDGQRYVSILSASAGATSEEGKPQLPEEGTLVGIPPNSSVSLEIMESRFEMQSSDPVFPAPRYTLDSNNEAIAHVFRDPDFYDASTGFYPTDVVRVVEFAHIRDQKVAKVIVHPLQFDPATHQLKRLTHLQVRCRFLTTAKAAPMTLRPVGIDPQFEPLYRDVLINYPQAKGFRFRIARANELSGGDSTAWFVPGKTYYRLPIGQDGMYRLTFAQLDSAGLDLREINLNTLALYTGGASVPLVVKASSPDPSGWYIDFYARRNYGPRSFYDLYSDTSYYWLTTDDDAPRRFQSTLSIPGSPNRQPAAFSRVLHFEQDLKYYFGYNQEEVATTNEVPGEGWYWTDFFPGTVWTYSFSADTVAKVSGGSAFVQARFFGMTKTATPSQHTAAVQINGTAIGQVSWTDNTEAVFSATFADSLLRSGTNTLKVISLTTSSPVNKFYLDWFEVSHSRPLIVTNDLLDYSDTGGMGISRYVIGGVTADSMDVYDLSKSRKVDGGSVASGTFAFQDTSSSLTQYVILGKDTRLSVSSIEAKVFTDLRHSQRGADYIVIAHHNFIDAARRLAQERASRGNLRAIVVDVQDVYDEFNFGCLKPDALREFLRYAYYNWPQPSPTYVVMFGDACWDFKGHLATTTKKNFVPAFGNPPSDNALVCFDPVQDYLPYMFVGRLPVENPLQADRLVTKILHYDDVPVDRWNKHSLFITGGIDSSEQEAFNYYSEDLIANNFDPPPVAGTVDRVYKSSSSIIDGESKTHMQNDINNGLGFVNFIGHSGGRIWNVDIGNPGDLQNTSGKLPFVCSVSCNVGFFSAPNFSVLAEDFLMADDRGAIAVWSGASLGYAVVGWRLADKFLSSVARDYGRSFGQLTTIAGINFWEVNGITTPLVVQTLQLHPLLGDPYSLFALPLKPDLDIGPEDVILSTDHPTSDSVVSLKVKLRNYGLVPHDSVLVSVADSYTNTQGKYLGEHDIVPPFSVQPFGGADSISIRWDVRGQAGTHVVTVAVDPFGSIPEIRKTNNTAQATFYIYKNIIRALKPIDFATRKSGIQDLVVTVPAVSDTTPLTYFFELDTLQDFSSPFMISSVPVTPGPVSAHWQSPPLPDGQTFFWRARSWDGSKYGAWTFSQFTTDDVSATVDSSLWRQFSRKQFSYDTLRNVSATDTGITLRSSNGLLLYLRSVGSRAYPDSDYYSIVRIGDVTVYGLYFYGAYSYIAARVDPLSGTYQGQGFDLRLAGQSDSLLNFLQNVPYGYYVAVSAVSDGKTGMTEPLYQTLESLGSTQIRSVQPGQSWCLLSRKGSGAPLMTPLESYVPSGIAVVQYQMPNFYSGGFGELLSPSVGPAHQWLSLAWESSVPAPTTTMVLTVYGVRQDSSSDSLMSFPGASGIVSLSFINPLTYPRLYLRAQLRNTDGIQTPILYNWSVAYVAPPDLATSAWAVHGNATAIQPGDTLTLGIDFFNIGFRDSDSGRVTITELPLNNVVQQVFVGRTAIGGSRHLQFSITPPGFPSAQSLTIDLQTVNDNDAFPGNNSVQYPFTVGAGKALSAASLEVLFDGRRIIEGDYVSARPTVEISIGAEVKTWQEVSQELIVSIDGKPVPTVSLTPFPVQISGKGEIRGTIRFQPFFKDGEHSLNVSLRMANQTAPLASTIHFHVLGETKLVNLFNYPNPFRDGTEFTFVLTGSSLGEGVNIKIYTVAGRLIRVIRVPPSSLRIGFNRVPWDGRDAESQEIANGYYFVKAILKRDTGFLETLGKVLKIR